MNANELRSLEQPVTAVPLEEVPPSLVDRATAYNEAVDAFREVVRATLERLRDGGAVDADRAESLRAAAADLVTAREWLLEIARLPSPARRAR
ncbi:MAG TPA: hypothetical protein VFL83_03370 [Anaeromyxobacter sp.]|nr:hypothetical protein [Anaeromyxobacter sp.]